MKTEKEKMPSGEVYNLYVADSVITKNTPANVMAVGNPCKVVKGV